MSTVKLPQLNVTTQRWQEVSSKNDFWNRLRQRLWWEIHALWNDLSKAGGLWLGEQNHAKQYSRWDSQMRKCKTYTKVYSDEVYSYSMMEKMCLTWIKKLVFVSQGWYIGLFLVCYPACVSVLTNVCVSARALCDRQTHTQDRKVYSGVLIL